MKRLLVVSLVVLAGCGTDGGHAPARPTAAGTGSMTAMAPAFLRVTGRTGAAMLVVVRRDGTTRIASRIGGAKVTIVGRGTRYARRGRLVAVTRASAGGVRLVNAKGHTLWRVRITKGRVQVRRGERNVRYEFRREGDDRIRVSGRRLTTGGVQATEQGARLLDAHGTLLGASSSPPADDLAVLLCQEIPPDLRVILAAALLPHL